MGIHRPYGTEFEGLMEKPNGRTSRWVRTEAAKHRTPESIRQRIARETEQIAALSGFGGASGPMSNALSAHHELIRVLTERLAETNGRNLLRVDAQLVPPPRRHDGGRLIS